MTDKEVVDVIKKDLVIIGAGPAGMCAAASAYENGIRDILILEREHTAGGILKQCIHTGFGLHRFGEELTGPEYAYRCEKVINEYGIECMTDATVISLGHNGKEKIVTVSHAQKGCFDIHAGAVILAMGCRERSRGAVNTAGTRPAGVFSAGTAQKYVNIMGVMPGKSVVILGSGDIGLIMARRMTLEGAKVKAVCEIMPYSGGLTRNIVQCLDDYGIPLKLSHTILKIHGKKRVSGVTIAEVDSNRKVIPGSEEYIECDTVLYSVGLIPENELTRMYGVPLDPATSGARVDQYRQTEMEGIFACGNVLHVHDLADYVSEEAEIAGKGAARYLKSKGEERAEKRKNVCAGNGVRYTVPQFITGNSDVSVFFRTDNVYENICIVISDGERQLLRIKKRRVSPGEMQRIDLKKDMIDKMKSEKLCVSLETGTETGG